MIERDISDKIVIDTTKHQYTEVEIVTTHGTLKVVVSEDKLIVKTGPLKGMYIKPRASNVIEVEIAN